MKTPESMQQLEKLFHEALELKAQEREDFLARVRNSNPDVGVAVESLIAAHERPDDFIDSPAYEAVAESISNAQPALVAGQVVAHYQILAPLGHGGMGEVYLALDTKLDRKVALKLLPPEFTNSKERVRRFIQEAKAASSLNHPNIITIHEIGQAENALFISTEFIDGLTLKRHMVRERLKLSDVLDVAIQTASALQAAHAAGIIHRDIKPENIMLRPDGYVKVLDFGLAKLTEKASQASTADSQADTLVHAHTKPGTLLGTVHYMSPEQARSQVLDPRTDIFSLGVVMYEMAAGRMAFPGATGVDILVSILEKEPPPLDELTPEVPAEFQRIIGKSLRKDREERYQTIKDLLIDLKSLKEELSFEQKLGRSRAPRSTAGGSHTGAVIEARAHATDQTKAATATADDSAPKATGGNRNLVVFALATLVLAGIVVGGIAVWRRSEQAPAATSGPATAPSTTPQRALSYWVTVQKYRDGKPFQDPFRLRDDINFENDYRIRLHVTSPQSGHLYILNENPAEPNQAPSFVVLFPSETANQGSTLLPKNEQVQIPGPPNWFKFDEKQVTEKIWLVWAEYKAPQMEAVKGFVNPKDRGLVSSPGLRTAVNEFLKANSSSKPVVERDEDKKETVVKADGQILVHLIKLEHCEAGATVRLVNVCTA